MKRAALRAKQQQRVDGCGVNKEAPAPAHLHHVVRGMEMSAAAAS